MRSGSKKLEKGSLLDKWLNREKDNKPRKGIEPRPNGVSVPLSLGQQRLLFLQQLNPENPFYNYADAYRFKGNLNLDLLLKSFVSVAENHEILRTSFKVKDGQAFQTIKNSANFETSKYDLRNRSPEDIQKIAVTEARKPFDLSSGSLVRLSFLQLAAEDYLVVLTMHHIIFDKWSMGILLREVAETYTKLPNGEELEIPRLDIQYADFVYWQSQKEIEEKDLTYWEEKLANSPELLNLPTDFARPHRPTFNGAYFTKCFPEILSKKLQSLCRERKTTPYVFLLTAYKILLNRYTNENDILVGSPFTNRDRLELERLIGFFNDTLVLRSDLSGNPTFVELLEQVKQTTHEAFAHKNTPFETLVKTLKPERYLNHNPLFQVMFIYHNVPEMPSFGDDLELEHEPFDFGVAKFDLTLYISEKSEREMSATFEYSKDLFEEETIDRMHRHLENLLEGIAENPNQQISDLPLITDEEKEQFFEWNNASANVISPKLIVDFFEDQVRTNPDCTAISVQNSRFTYRELNERANAVANYLLSLNLNRKQPIGLFLESSLEMIVGIFGILKAGFAYLPLDAEYPKERIDYILEDSGASIVLTQDVFLGKISDETIEVHKIGEIITSARLDAPILSDPISKDDLAYIMYTSGRTGKPKGVAVTHGNLAYSTAARFGLYSERPETFLLFSSFSFDSSVVGIFWTLATGGHLVLGTRRIEQDLAGLANILEKEKITHTLLLPSLYSQLIKSIPKSAFDSLDTVIVAGEVFPTSLCKEHFEILPNVKLYNEYGPTEATVWTTAHRIILEDSGSKIPIGKPISGTKVYILGDNQKQVPIGVSGEMYIGGKGVAKGYFNDLEFTNTRFIQNAFDDTAEEKLYRTGDICRYRSDGAIEFIGRKDDQVKVRGFRIELNEIEEAIKQDTEIIDAIVKLESINEEIETNDETDVLLNALRGLKPEEADEVLRSIENFSDEEIQSMIGKTASA